MSTTMFKGARYLVKFDGDWSADNSYEAITAVKHNAYTYISKQPVPADVDISNTDFWLLWADPNAQMEELRQLVVQYKESADAAGEKADSAIAMIGEGFSAEDTVANAIDLLDGRIETLEDLADNSLVSQDLVSIETFDNASYNLMGFAVKIPRNSFKLEFCTGNGTQYGATAGDIVNGFAIELLNSGLIRNWNAIYNCCEDGLKIVNGSIAQNTNSGHIGQGNTHCIVYFEQDSQEMHYTYDDITATQLIQREGASKAFNAFECFYPIVWDGQVIVADPESIYGTLRRQKYTQQMVLGCDDEYWYAIVFMARCPGHQMAPLNNMVMFMQNYYPGVNSVSTDCGGSVQFYVASSQENLVVTSDDKHIRYARDRKHFMGFSKKGE